MDPLPENAEANLTGRHIFHEVEDVIVAKEVGRLEGRGLETLAEGVAVL